MRCLRIIAVAAVAVAGLVAQPSDSVAQPRPPELAANTRVIIDYIDPRLPRSQATLDRLRKRQVLEELSMFLSPLRLPRVLRVRTKSCGAGECLLRLPRSGRSVSATSTTRTSKRSRRKGPRRKAIRVTR